jgi:hypothetical protein
VGPRALGTATVVRCLAESGERRGEREMEGSWGERRKRRG